MMSLDRIRNASAMAAARAATDKRVPLLVTQDDLDGNVLDHLRYMPFLGDYTPPGYEKVNEYFVDSSGCGTEGGSAISAKLFSTQVKVGMSYAVVESGQFQVYIGEFKKVE